MHVLISFLVCDTRQNMQDQNETTWMHYQEDVSVLLSKNYFYKTELVVNYHSGVYSDRDIKMCHCSFSAIFKNQF